MSDFYAQLAGGNVRLPDTNINGGGPLPTSLSGVTGINGDPDGQYNFNSDLLSGVTPYAFGQGRMGSDRSYQQVPHRMQKIIPKLFLPYADFMHDNELLGLSHSVDQGDVAFVLQSNYVQSLLFDSVQIRDASIYKTPMPSRSAFINISTVNYLMAGLQRISASQKNTSTWVTLANNLGYDYKRSGDTKENRTQILKLVSTRMLPFGICAGSEKQGGQNETGLAPVQAAANHVSTLTVDGQNRDLVNFWRHTDLSAGDELIYVLRWLPTHHYTLNHYYKGTVRQTFTNRTNCWQLVPEKFDMSADPPVHPDQPWHYDYHIHGYWRVAQTFQHRGKYESTTADVANDMTYMRGQLLQVTFAPAWMQYQEFNNHDDITAHKSGASYETHTRRIDPRDASTRKTKRDWSKVKASNDPQCDYSARADKSAKTWGKTVVPTGLERWKTTIGSGIQTPGMLAIRGMFTSTEPAAVIEHVSLPVQTPEVANMQTLQTMLESVATPAQLDEIQLDVALAKNTKDKVAVPEFSTESDVLPPVSRPAKVRVNKPKKVANVD